MKRLLAFLLITAGIAHAGDLNLSVTSTTSADAKLAALYWEYPSAQPDTTGNLTYNQVVASDHSGTFDSGITAAIADADSGRVILSWANPASSDATMYRIQMQPTSGAAWATVANIAASLESWTHEVGTAIEEPVRGEPTYRVNGFFFTGTDTTWGDVAVLTERFMNQANRVYCRLYADDGVTVVSSGVDSELFIAQVEDSGGGALPGSPTHHWDSMTSDDLTLSGDVITAWDDKIGDWDWVRYGTGVTGPYYRAANQLNGHTAAYFDGTSWMRRTAGFIGGADYTIAFSYKADSVDEGGLYSGLWNEATSNEPRVSPLYWNTSFTNAYARQNAAFTASTEAATIGYHNWIVSYDSSAGTISVWLDGVQVLTDSSGAADYTSATRVVIGGMWYASAVASMVGTIAEIVVYDDTITNTDAVGIDSYFSRWD